MHTLVEISAAASTPLTILWETQGEPGGLLSFFTLTPSPPLPYVRRSYAFVGLVSISTAKPGRRRAALTTTRAGAYGGGGPSEAGGE
jgi:hypothetical protein